MTECNLLHSKMANARVVIFVVLVVFFLECVNAKILFPKLGLPPAGAPNSKSLVPDWGTFEARVDPYRVSDNDMFKIRYMNNSQFFLPGGPMFVLLGGEWEISPDYLRSGQMFDMAEEHNGYMFYLERRNYGKSFTTEDLAKMYLSTDHCIYDVGSFIKHQKETIPGLKDSKVVVVGASHSASVATWVRMKLPHLVNIAIASGGPLRAVDDFYEYYEIVGEAIGKVSKTCVNVIKEATEKLEAAAADSKALADIAKKFNTCKSLNLLEPDWAFFFKSIASIFGELVEFAKPGDIEKDCKELLAYPGDSLDKLAEYVKKRYNGNCMGGYDEYIEVLSQPEYETSPYRPWIYQRCMEFGYFQTGSSEKQPFSKFITPNLYHTICRDLFKEDFNSTKINDMIKFTNVVYGSVDVDMTRLITVQGTLDPWHSLGLQHDINSLSPTILIEGSSHCQDLSSVSDLDPVPLKNAKIWVKRLLAKMLQYK